MIVVILLVVLAQFIACPFDDVTLEVNFICESDVLTYIILSYIFVLKFLFGLVQNLCVAGTNTLLILDMKDPIFC